MDAPLNLTPDQEAICAAVYGESWPKVRASLVAIAETQAKIEAVLREPAPTKPTAP